MERTDISIAMAVYNGGRFLDAQLESLFEQSLKPCEIIVCDDLSEDDTAEVIEQWRKKHPEVVKYYRNSERLGVARNFEHAISLCTGRIIFLCDQDDVWLSNKLEVMSRLIDDSSQMSGSFTDSLLVDDELRPLGRTHWENRGFKLADIIDPPTGMLDLFLKRVPAAGHDMAFDARLKEVLLPFPDLPECHDTWIGMLLAAMDCWNVVEEPLTLFRQHAVNVSGSGRKITWRRCWQEAKKSIRNNTFAWNAALYQALVERLAPRCPAEVLMELEERRCHSVTRAAMNTSFFHRLPMIMGEIANRNYFKYARGWQSIVQDLFLR